MQARPAASATHASIPVHKHHPLLFTPPTHNEPHPHTHPSTSVHATHPQWTTPPHPPFLLCSRHPPTHNGPHTHTHTLPSLCVCRCSAGPWAHCSATRSRSLSARAGTPTTTGSVRGGGGLREEGPCICKPPCLRHTHRAALTCCRCLLRQGQLARTRRVLRTVQVSAAGSSVVPTAAAAATTPATTTVTTATTGFEPMTTATATTAATVTGPASSRALLRAPGCCPLLSRGSRRSSGKPG